MYNLGVNEKYIYKDICDSGRSAQLMVKKLDRVAPEIADPSLWNSTTKQNWPFPAKMK